MNSGRLDGTAGREIRRADAIIVGAGFAGITALRELRAVGLDAWVLEAQERIGGRTMTGDFDGFLAEFGGQWVHWLQPHVWAEITRYGLDLYERPPVDHALWIADGAVHEGSMADLHAVYGDAWTRLLAGADTAFPRPYEPFAAGEALSRLDGVSLGDRLEELGVPTATRDVVRALASVSFNAIPDDGALTQSLRRLALVGGDIEGLPNVARYKLREGSRALLEAILGSNSPRVRTRARVTKIVERDGGVQVTTADGTSYRSRAAIVTVPLHTLEHITFDADLAQRAAAVASHGQMTAGAMLWVRLRGGPRHFLCLAPPEQLFNYARYDGEHDDGVIVNVFAADARRLRDADRALVERGLRAWLPQAEVLDFRMHDWVSDPYARQTWTMLRPGQLTGPHRDLTGAHGPVVLAGSDYADGWLGFIDGAIESAFKAARHVADQCTSDARTTLTDRRTS